MVCPNCGNDSNGKRFCALCGADLGSPLAMAADDSDVITSPGAVSKLSATGGLTGITLDQKYYLESELGVGGMGTVYRASRLLIGDWVAVKVLHQDQMADPRAVERFRREAQISARLRHPNVVAVYDFGVSSEGLSYLVMDLAEGESLGSLIERQGALAETDAAEIVRQVCAALDEAHGKGVIHRDIKPQNIIVQTIPEGLQVKVLDFGSAASLDAAASRLTRNGAIVGTPHYMSPEHCLGEELDGRSDIYSLGIVLFEMLTGIVPFDSPTTTAIVVKHVNDPPPPPRRLNPNISPAVESVALRALEKQRDARPQTAGEMARELIASAGNPGPDSFQRSTMVTEPENIMPEPVTTPISEEEVAPESNSAEAISVDTAPAYGEAIAKTGSSGRSVLLVFCALILLAAGGLWWYLHNEGEQSGEPKGLAESGLRGPTASDQPSTPPSESQLASENLWRPIPSQIRGVSDAANALGRADQRTAVISPGGQLALEYSEGRLVGDGYGSDLRVYAPEQQRVSYIIFVRNDPAEDWKQIDMNRRGFPGRQIGHDIGHHGIRQARQVMIRNTGNADLKIDSVLVLYDVVQGGGVVRHRR